MVPNGLCNLLFSTLGFLIAHSAAEGTWVVHVSWTWNMWTPWWRRLCEWNLKYLSSLRSLKVFAQVAKFDVYNIMLWNSLAKGEIFCKSNHWTQNLLVWWIPHHLHPRCPTSLETSKPCDPRRAAEALKRMSPALDFLSQGMLENYWPKE